MKKLGLYFIGIILLVGLILPISAQETKSFEDVLKDYGFQEKMVFNDGNYTSYEVEGIPAYKFTYIMDIEFSQHPLRYFLNLFGLWYQTKTVRVPAIDMTDEGWIQNAHLFIIPKEEFIDELLMEHGIKEKDVTEIKIVDNNGLPGYRIQTNILEPVTLKGEGIYTSILVPAIELGNEFGGGKTQCIDGKLMVIKPKTAGQLGGLWGGSGSSSALQIEGECS